VAFIDELYPDCVFRCPSIGEVRGAAYRQFMRPVIAAFPDGLCTVEDQVAPVRMRAPPVSGLATQYGFVNATASSVERLASHMSATRWSRCYQKRSARWIWRQIARAFQVLFRARFVATQPLRLRAPFK
jgi:hypothetical protein